MKQILNIKVLNLGYFLTIALLFFYSFTQVDLSLTLSKFSIWQVIQKSFQEIGYFNRPLSAILYIIIIFLLFIFYFLFLIKIKKKLITKKEFLTMIIFTCILLTFSYNAFSYDIFNYIFDAKIFTHYQQNPFIHKALDFPGDPMLSFMHWTHRIYPYGPTWLLLTVPLSYLGFQLFLPTYFLFKILITICFLGTVLLIGKILRKISPENELYGMAFFAMNPLVIIESLISSHNDIVMVFFTMISFYLLISRKYFWAFILLAISIGIKFATGLLIPAYIIYLILNRKKKENKYNIFIYLSLILMMLAVLFAVLRTNFQPWYLLYILPFAAFSSKKYFILIPSIIFSLFSLFQYVPFLYRGDWNPPVPAILLWLTLAPIMLSIIFTIWFSFYFRNKLLNNSL